MRQRGAAASGFCFPMRQKIAAAASSSNGSSFPEKETGSSKGSTGVPSKAVSWRWREITALSTVKEERVRVSEVPSPQVTAGSLRPATAESTAGSALSMIATAFLQENSRGQLALPADDERGVFTRDLVKGPLGEKDDIGAVP